MAAASADRRQFLSLATTGVAAMLLPSPASARVRHVLSRSHGPHPEPRKGYTAAKVLTADQIDDKDLVPLFDGVRAIPQVVDGIRCHCGCADEPDKYSLLSCYEGTEAMALWCPICEGQGRLTIRLHKSGKTLDEIRKAVDARF